MEASSRQPVVSRGAKLKQETLTAKVRREPVFQCRWKDLTTYAVEKCFVFEDWAAEYTTEVILPLFRFRKVVIACKPVVGVQDIVSEIFSESCWFLNASQWKSVLRE